MLESITWIAVPNKRRTLERRHMRRLGPNGHFEVFKIKHNLTACKKCGNYKEEWSLCVFCLKELKQKCDIFSGVKF